LRAFQLYISCHLQINKLVFSTFSGWKSNCQFDFRPSFGHNLCFRCLNEWCELTLDIYIPRAFQWYKEHLKPLNFDTCNRSLKIWDSISQVGVALGVWGLTPSHFPTFLRACSVIPGLLFGSQPCNPFCLGRKLKVRVAKNVRFYNVGKVKNKNYYVSTNFFLTCMNLLLFIKLLFQCYQLWLKITFLLHLFLIMALIISNKTPTFSTLDILLWFWKFPSQVQVAFTAVLWDFIQRSSSGCNCAQIYFMHNITITIPKSIMKKTRCNKKFRHHICNWPKHACI
jgi:hypothetical protein